MGNATKKKFTFYDCAVLLVHRKEDGATIDLVSPEGLLYAKLRYLSLGISNMRFQILFKRTPELSPYNAKIHDWFKANNLDLKDISIDGVSYLGTESSKPCYEICTTLESIQNEIFGFEQTYFRSSNTQIQYEIYGIKSPYTLMFSALIIIPTWIGMVLYEILHLGQIRSPSFINISHSELFLTSIILICAYNLKKHRIKTDQTKKRTSKTKKWTLRFLLILPLFIAFYTA